MTEKVDLFLDELRSQGLNAPRSGVAAIIQNRVDAVAATLRISGTAARRYVTEDSVRELARGSAATLFQEAPGADLLELPATHTVRLGLAGRTVSGLAIVTELATTAHAPDSQDMQHAAGQGLTLLTTWGLLLERAAAHSASDGTVPVPEALIHRTVRELERGVTHVLSGVHPLDGGDPDALREALESNVMDLNDEL